MDISEIDEPQASICRTTHSFFESITPTAVAPAQLFSYIKCNYVAILAFMFSLQKQAEEMIRRRGERVTPGRVRVFAILLAEQRAVTHQEIEKSLPDKPRLNRVTLYRILEWLDEKCFVHKVVGDDRIWHFRANSQVAHHQHAHFECMRCTRVVCLDDIKAEYDSPLPAGYQSREIELRVKGLCAECA
ncbi:Fur family transcriptional regulator [Nitrosospira sp. Nsp1]|uniref:Fur family transcriptional regulator n=1 Tax=Nitrosospira sp. Nsp1 TaxID=136547 RepID=UPI00088DB1D5|nr:transcriptional repressor [Nitrosospira sp. Nsp1]SCX53818.1 Fur family transcriptional regulator, ferric uptake regulator [Nitrosospira sp. Nsp1]